MLIARRILPIAALFLTIFLVGFAVYSSSAYQACITEKSQQASDQQQKERHTAFVVMVYVDCLGPFSHENHGPITAVATIFIAIFTWTLWWSTSGMLRATFDTIELARKEFDSTHRARLRVRNVVLDEQFFPNGKLRFTDGPVTGELYVMNIGATTATVTASDCLIQWLQGPLPMRRSNAAHRNDFVPIGRKLISGELYPAKFNSEIRPTIEASVFDSPGWHLYVRGWIQYHDGGGNSRRTAFCRELKKGRFMPVKVRDYEYED